MTNLVVWSGPVYEAQVSGATVPGAELLFLQCRGDIGPHPYCPTIGDNLHGNPELLLAKAKLGPEQLGDLFLAAFSAGGSVIKRCLMNPDYRQLTTAVHLADATYTGAWLDTPEGRVPPPIEGLTRYAVDVITGPGDKLFIATASPNPNFVWATGIQNLQAIRREVEQRTGQSFIKLDHFWGVEPAPEAAYQLGNVIFAEYPSKPLGHGHTKIAPQIWKNIICPWLSKGKGPVDELTGLPPIPGQPPPPAPPGVEDPSLVGPILLTLAAFAGGYWAMRKWWGARG